MINVVFPFLHQIGVLWLTGSIHPAHEHFITNLIRQKLFVAIDAQTGASKGKARRFLLFLPEGEPHEIGLLFANYMIRSRGHEVVYLGQNLPFDDLKVVFEFYNPEYVLSAVTSGVDEGDIQRFVDTISKTWPNATVMLTGFQIVNAKSLICPENVVVIPDLETLKTFVEQVDYATP